MMSHPTDDQLELYALRRLSQADSEALEDHLLVCDACRARCEDVTDFAVAMRDALKTAPAEVERRWFGWLRPNAALVPAFAALLLALALYWNAGRGQLTAVASLQLTAMRGSEVATAEPARELDVTLPDAAAASRIEIVGADGAAVWTGANKPTIVVSQELAARDYLLRAYLPSGELLHEYTFRIQNRK